jgi:hypothetical protein
MLSALITAAAVAGATPNYQQNVLSGVAQDCASTASRSGSVLGYFGLTGEGPTQAFLRGSPPGDGRFVDDLNDGGGQVLGYTRVRAEFIPCSDADLRDYHTESRGWLRRWVAGLKADKALTVRVSVESDNIGNVGKDFALTKLTRTSTKNGDEWDTGLTESDILLPYFLVGQNTVIKVEPSFVASSDYSSSAAADIVNIAQQAAAIINPAVPLITTENRESFTKATNFIDGTINGLLHRRIGEQAVSVRIPRDLARGGDIAHILLFTPRANSTVSSGAIQPVGVWIIRAEPIIRSLFGRQNADGSLQMPGLSASVILGYTVAEKKSVRDALLARNGVTVARDAYLAAKGADRVKAGAQFCNVVANESAKIGFSPVDVRGVVWAMAKDVEPEQTANDALLRSCSTSGPFPS